jgi:hypothetical protein
MSIDRWINMLELRGSFTWRDSLQAFWISVRPRPVWAIVGIALLALAVALASFEWRGYLKNGGHAPSPLTYSLVVLIFMFAVYYPWIHYQRFQKSKTMSLPVTYQFGNDEIIISNELSTTRFPWTIIVAARESKNMYLLYDAAGPQVAIPKRFATSPDAQSHLREQLASRGLVV